MFFIIPPFFEISILIKWTDHTRSTVDKMSHSNAHVLVTFQLTIYSFAVTDFATPQSFYLTKV